MKKESKTPPKEGISVLGIVFLFLGYLLINKGAEQEKKSKRKTKNVFEENDDDGQDTRL